MSKVIRTTYEILEDIPVDQRLNYRNALANILRQEALIVDANHSKFLMRDGTVIGIPSRANQGYELEVTRNTRKEPQYISDLVTELRGVLVTTQKLETPNLAAVYHERALSLKSGQ